MLRVASADHRLPDLRSTRLRPNTGKVHTLADRNRLPAGTALPERSADENDDAWPLARHAEVPSAFLVLPFHNIDYSHLYAHAVSRCPSRHRSETAGAGPILVPFEYGPSDPRPSGSRHAADMLAALERRRAELARRALLNAEAIPLDEEMKSDLRSLGYFVE